MHRQHSFLLFSLLITTFTSSLTGCGKLKGCEHNGWTDFTFEIPVTISPVKDTFNIGDTIWININYGDQLVNYEYDKHKTYDMTGYDFKTWFSITDLNTPKPSYSYPNPNIITYKGNSISSSIATSNYSLISISYAHENNMNLYKAAFVIDKAGFYAIAFSNAIRENTRGIDKCPNEHITVNYPVNNNGDNNFEMLQYAPGSDFGSLSLSEFNQAGGYCFYVK
jgi:hypothetical protein